MPWAQSTHRIDVYGNNPKHPSGLCTKVCTFLGLLQFEEWVCPCIIHSHNKCVPSFTIHSTSSLPAIAGQYGQSCVVALTTRVAVVRLVLSLVVKIELVLHRRTTCLARLICKLVSKAGPASQFELNHDFKLLNHKLEAQILTLET